LDGIFDSENYSIPLDFTSSAMKSRIFGSASADIIKILKTENVTMNNHHYGIYTDHFLSTESLSSFFHLLSTNDDKQGVEFVSTMEAYKYPIYGVQWHPEKNAFE
jgi:gamma-glutamyl hydrolase